MWSMSVQGQFYIAFLALVFAFALLLRRPLGKKPTDGLHYVADSLTVASFVFAVIIHRADQTAAYYNSFAGPGSCCWAPWWGAGPRTSPGRCGLRTAAAAIGLAAIVSCGALIDGVKQFPGPWALVPVGAAVLLILAAANRQSHPSTRDRLPLPNRLLAAAPLVALGRWPTRCTCGTGRC